MLVLLGSRNGRDKTLYHIKYDDGDKEDLDAEEYQYAFELNLDSPQTCDEGSSSNETVRILWMTRGQKYSVGWITML